MGSIYEKIEVVNLVTLPLQRDQGQELLYNIVYCPTYIKKFWSFPWCDQGQGLAQPRPLTKHPPASNKQKIIYTKIKKATKNHKIANIIAKEPELLVKNAYLHKLICLTVNNKKKLRKLQLKNHICVPSSQLDTKIKPIFGPQPIPTPSPHTRVEGFSIFFRFYHILVFHE